MSLLWVHLYNLAAANPLCSAEDCDLPIVDTSAPGTFVSVMNRVFFAAGLVAVIMIIIGGFQYVLSGGNPDKAAQAWRTILYSFIGLIIVLSAGWIINFVGARLS
ncbi:hypothetical protein HY346_03075 [Candidatus Microgenomates bacterium]|nr:hypothetical protein [Candidatus Microgenomates bacterium]